MNEKNSTEPSIEEVIQEKDTNKQKEKYNAYVKNMTPKSNPFCNCLKAFFVGGCICTIGEALIKWYRYLGNDKELAGIYASSTVPGWLCAAADQCPAQRCGAVVHLYEVGSAGVHCCICAVFPGGAGSSAGHRLLSGRCGNSVDQL